MNTRIIKQTIITISLLIGVASADIPGLFVVQQANIADPVLLTNRNPTKGISEFGGSDIRSIGDFNLDGVDDIITGARKSFQDSGSIILVSLNSDGSAKSTAVYSASDNAISGFLDPNFIFEKFGDGIAALTRFSPSQNCADIIISSAVVKKLYGATLCRESGANPKLTIQSVIDSASSALNGLPFTTSQIASTMTVVDTISATGEFIVALGASNASWASQNGTKSNAGAVVLLAA